MIRINLLRQKISAPPTFSIDRSGLLLTALALLSIALIALGSWAWRLGTEIETRRGEVAVLDGQALRLAEAHKQIVRFEVQKKMLDERIAAIERLREKQTGPVDLLESLLAGIPDRPTLWLTSLSQQGKKVTVEGRSFDVPSIADLISRLGHSRVFKNVELAYWQEEESSIKFQLNCEAK